MRHQIDTLPWHLKKEKDSGIEPYGHLIARYIFATDNVYRDSKLLPNSW